jgi:hypothetical protein
MYYLITELRQNGFRIRAEVIKHGRMGLKVCANLSTKKGLYVINRARSIMDGLKLTRVETDLRTHKLQGIIGALAVRRKLFV